MPDIAELPPFKFELSQRVTVKAGNIGTIEGVVSGCKRMIRQGNEYDVHFLADDLMLAHVVVPEDELVRVQPGKMVPADVAAILAEVAYKRGCFEMVSKFEAGRKAECEIRAAMRIDRAAKRRTRAARKRGGR